MAQMTVQVVTPDGLKYDHHASFIHAVTKDGQIGILPGHINLIAPLEVDELKVRRVDDESHVDWIAVRQTPKAESPISQAWATPTRNFSEQMAKAKSFERGESNGNRRNILQAYEARQDAVTETIKVIAIKKERGFQTTRTNRLKSAIGF